jgi:predicted O-linked N-acetylglucosamine transferase (SPINDLY family)
MAWSGAWNRFWIWHRFQALNSFDVFPWNGHTTACEALWMGVPVVALRGNRHAGRMVASILEAVGLPELVGATPADYRRVAVELAGDVPRLAGLSASLRERMLASPLCDGVAFTRGLEAAYRQMWQRWCERAVSPERGALAP